MRCSSSALVLGTLAIGQAAAGTLRHANFHARRNAEAQGKNEVYVFSFLSHPTKPYLRCS